MMKAKGKKSMLAGKVASKEFGMGMVGILTLYILTHILGDFLAIVLLMIMERFSGFVR